MKTLSTSCHIIVMNGGLNKTNHLLKRLFLVLLIGLPFVLKAQKKPELHLLTQTDKIVKRFEIGKNTTIKYQMDNRLVKITGPLVIENDSQISINETVIPIQSIQRIGHNTREKKFLGHGMAAAGLAITGLGVYVTYLGISYTGNSFVVQLFYIVAGASLVGVGAPFIAVGETIAAKSTVNPNRYHNRLVVEKFEPNAPSNSKIGF
jgi:hypothetical protein